VNDEIWAITTFFNPCGYKSKYENYKKFRQQLNIPLVTAELLFDKPSEIQDDDADIVLRYTDGDVLWQRERLVNLAVSAVPSSCDKVVYLDADVFFGGLDWAIRTSQMLDEHMMVQPYSSICRLSLEYSQYQFSPEEPERLNDPNAVTGKGFVYWLIKTGRITGYPGLAWAFRRSLLEEHGMYDAFPVGAGDKALAISLSGNYSYIKKRFYLDEVRTKHFLSWAEPFSASVNNKVGCIDEKIYTYFHGSHENRKYLERHAKLAQFHFNPSDDLCYGRDGCWRWGSDKPELHEYVKQYFYSRKEDELGEF